MKPRHIKQSFIEEKVLGRCYQAIITLDASAHVILYGSRARGDAAPDSDYDLLVLTDGDANLQQEDIFRNQLYPIELETGAVLTLRVLSKALWQTPLYQAMPLYQNILREGVVL